MCHDRQDTDVAVGLIDAQDERVGRRPVLEPHQASMRRDVPLDGPNAVAEGPGAAARPRCRSRSQAATDDARRRRDRLLDGRRIGRPKDRDERLGLRPTLVEAQLLQLRGRGTYGPVLSTARHVRCRAWAHAET